MTGAVRVPRRWGSSLTLLISVGAVFATAATSQAATEPVAQSPPEEVVVRGHRSVQKQLVALRNEMIRLEDQFYTAYNALNQNDLFDIHCAERVKTGTRLERRTCRVGYEARALETEGRAHLLALEYQAREPPMEWIPPHSPFLTIAMHRQGFRENLRSVTEQNPELLDPLRQRAVLLERYEVLQKKIFTGRD